MTDNIRNRLDYISYNIFFIFLVFNVSLNRNIVTLNFKGFIPVSVFEMQGFFSLLNSRALYYALKNNIL